MLRKHAFSLGLFSGLLIASVVVRSSGRDAMDRIIRAMHENDESRAGDYILDFDIIAFLVAVTGLVGFLIVSIVVFWSRKQT
jgi:uncharacterized BrkB/YihY/UPF0761 family membrane protein